MEEVWDRLCRATSNDVPLLAFLQQLLSLDPAPRAHFAALAQHPYLHLDQPPQGDSPLPAAAAAAASDAVVPAAVMPDEAVWKASLSLSGLCMPEEVECMVPIPGIPFLVYNPIKKPLCATSSGGVHR